MRYILTGDESNLFSFAFQDATISDTSTETVLSPLEVSVFNSANGAQTTLLGTGLKITGSGVASGRVTEILVFDEDGSPVGRIEDIDWRLSDLFNGLRAIENNGDLAPLAALINASESLTVDLSEATDSVDIEDELNGLLPLITRDVTVLDGPNDADVGGGRGDDTFVLRGADDTSTFIYVETSEGDDTYDARDVSDRLFLSLDFDQDFSSQSFGINARIDGPNNTATISFGSHTHTILGVDRLMRIGDGIFIDGSRETDHFEITTSEESFFNMRGGEGRDSYDLTLNSDTLLRLSFNFGADGPPDSGANVNLSAEAILNDGFGNTEPLDITWNGGRVELLGTNFADRLTGSVYSDSFLPQLGNDTINGGGGSDHIDYYFMRQFAVDTNFTDGISRIFDENGALQGTARLTSIEVVEGSDGGDDTLTGSAGDDSLWGYDGDDRIFGLAGVDSLWGGDGQDTLSGGLGDDSVAGGRGNDLLRGNIGQDEIYGGDGDDVLRGQSEADYLEGNDGDDNVKGGGGNDTLIGGDGRDFLNGGTRRDLIEGDDGNDILIGRSFDDTLIGGDGDDQLNAGGDNDRLEGGSGNDFIKGGAGADVFVFDTGFDLDRIADFDALEDRLEVSSALANGRSAADIANLATLQGSLIEIDFGGGDIVQLLGAPDITDLASRIDII